jgi:hypothetical protein
LFLFFGVQMVVKAARTAPGEGASEELEEVEGELKARDAQRCPLRAGTQEQDEHVAQMTQKT